MTMTRTVSCTVVLTGLMVGSLFAQGMFGGQRRDPGGSLADIFGKEKSFTATARTSIKPPDGNNMQMEMSYAVLEGKVRTEMDMTKMQGGGMPPEALAQMKAMGMDKTVTIMLPEKHTGYLIYPGLKAYCSLPMGPGASGAETNKPPKIERTEMGKETVDGHPCVKYKVVITAEGEAPLTTYVWQATDLKDYPVQTEVTAEGATITTLFQNINQSKPSASLFDPPADFKQYGSMQELMMSGMGGMGGMPGRRSMPPMPRGGRE
jgi:hypothetical protein